MTTHAYVNPTNTADIQEKDVHGVSYDVGNKVSPPKAASGFTLRQAVPEWDVYDREVTNSLPTVGDLRYYTNAGGESLVFQGTVGSPTAKVLDTID